MSLKYAEKRIEEALALAQGNIARARVHVLSWAAEDPKLLKALTQQHMNGIVAYHVERVASGRHEKPPPAGTSEARRPPKAREESTFGMEILKAVADSNAVMFGLEGDGLRRPGQQVSAEHIKAIRRLAENTKPPKK
ncbi:MAG: hypothetical protein K9G62_01975 [Alphaproteobacteria bacterium]|nr:hypothetical protein [Alphaproteobacteria bacterium]